MIRTTTAADWLAAHLFHHGNLDDLLVRLVAPLVRELDRPAFFLRYWDGGNHVRLRVLAPDDRDAVGAVIRDRAEAYFAESPAPDLMSAEHYRSVAPGLALGEGLTDYLPELRPNNSVLFQPYTREHHRYGHGASMEAAEHHFAESSAVVLDLLGTHPSTRQRDTACYALILLAWFAAEPDPVRLTAWRDRLDRGWAERFGPLGVVAEAESAQVFERDRGTLVAIADRLRAGRVGGSVLGRWSASVTALAASLRRPDARAPEGGPLPVLDACAHLLCNRLGVSPAAEVHLRRLAVAAVLEATR
ncbi:hypothetical protein GCM10022243_30260 [Saccharothrix violaceirubra]|uniref:Thiopeptide-type bacteriocin biosynthesis protein n=1 Tax=Saccharothrix violaceirubra TaxID=413306 RepID=A0A7W7WWS4_9PSEU|nr:thiopeptide-type bacteriocin biosynthesis protein [Saccharothrix violaceirubra]MBB4966650.1 thiopeptide-type bacteriocin biosynthesis protein [Saccharothrix violaceirubra]